MEETPIKELMNSVEPNGTLPQAMGEVLSKANELYHWEFCEHNSLPPTWVVVTEERIVFGIGNQVIHNLKKRKMV